MLTINLLLNLPPASFEKESVVTVYFKNRTNIIGTCSIEQTDSRTIGNFTIAEELHDNLFICYIFNSRNGESILDGILLDDRSPDKTIDTVGTMKLKEG